MRNVSKKLYVGPLKTYGLDETHGATVAGTLKQARLDSKKSLEDIAKEIRIPVRYLDAIEAQNMEKMPGITYALGYVRAYANHLGLDGQDSVTKFKREISQNDRITKLAFPRPTAGTNQPGVKIFLVCFGIIFLTYLGWISFSQHLQVPVVMFQNMSQKIQSFFS